MAIFITDEDGLFLTDESGVFLILDEARLYQIRKIFTVLSRTVEFDILPRTTEFQLTKRLC